MLKSVLLLALLASVKANEQALQEFNTGNRLFSTDVYREMLAKHHENFVVSPFSAEAILALAQSGAKGETAEEIRTALHLPDTAAAVDSAFEALLPNLTHTGRYTFHIANKMYIKENYPVKTEFTKKATEIYRSTSENIDFSRQTEAVDKINHWVAQQTDNKIQNLVSSGSLTPDTVAVLINVLYFRGEWKKAFKSRLTQKRDFFRSPEDVVQVDTMKQSGFNGYFESKELDAKFLQLPFRSADRVEMVVVLPNSKNGLAALEDRIGEVLAVPKFNWEYVNVDLPKFKVATKINFKKILKKLGVKKAFLRADFSGMAGERGDIFISDVLQKSFIAIDENGVEAAAATAVHFRPKSLIEYMGEKKDFKADHPFLFYLRVNGVVAFIGRIVSPA